MSVGWAWDGRGMGVGWASDGRGMGVGWALDGRRMGVGWALDGRWMVPGHTLLAHATLHVIAGCGGGDYEYCRGGVHALQGRTGTRPIPS